MYDASQDEQDRWALAELAGILAKLDGVGSFYLGSGKTQIEEAINKLAKRINARISSEEE